MDNKEKLAMIVYLLLDLGIVLWHPVQLWGRILVGIMTIALVVLFILFMRRSRFSLLTVRYKVETVVAFILALYINFEGIFLPANSLIHTINVVLFIVMLLLIIDLSGKKTLAGNE
ncbi:hypothetical protein [Lactobacillus sp.]|uniref:hypothetical protein n=1 Tax=Lactobacillus sp. TaxID=1591 RepID=UPI0019ADB0C2|nr:hypothetical protein [Lactobacillus sp.]MBD5430617.1 hypothetical protein [Lactobacillus sp.]